ncbi:MAG: hypothetical protein LLF98_12930 [Clostridium sp.]|uniref:hypothetical protein n=1 Tax=Clostridium sp. TaxID=1506 RepID=UPI0025BA1CEB|nr:hypothetical protein [Clostridium sp.]MCE5222117.1 hypothetical protein [Clostridium sp.]
MPFGTLTIYKSVLSWLHNPIYIILYLLIIGILIYIFDVKYACHGQASDTTLANKDVLTDKNK